MQHSFDGFSFGFIGLGLIGGSLAKAMRAHFPDCRIIAYNRREEPRILAKKEGVADVVCDKIDDSFSECDYIFLCTPVQYNEQYLELLKPVMKKNCILTDAGSVKGNIHRAAKRCGLQAQFIGGHPMAGSEKTGYENSSANLCEKAIYAITPTPLSPPERVEEYRLLIEEIGAVPIILSAEEHDRAVAGISHLPHLVAASMVELVKEQDSDRNFMKQMAAGGFKDITRIASSSPQMWEQIAMANGDEICRMLELYTEKLQTIKEQIRSGDGEAIRRLFESGGAYRNSIT